MRFTLPKWYDLHAHFRQDELIAPVIKDHIAMGCVGILAMPNTKPPVTKVLSRDDGQGWSIEEYLAMLKNGGGDVFDDMIVPLYLSADTTPQMIEAGAKSGFLRACKYYPPHGTTGAGDAAPFQSYIDNNVFRAMQENGVVLCIHGEEHGLEAERYFDQNENAEEIFYKTHMPKLLEHVPDLKIVCEHVTTKVAVGFVIQAHDGVAATITPQHLLYTVGDLLKGLKYHLFCLPLLKFEKDREALRQAATQKNNHRFFAGTDSAPHTHKMTDCGCAAGCYTGGIAPQLYAQGFEEAGLDLSQDDTQGIFKQFLCTNGPEFYGLPISNETFTLEKTPQEISALKVGGNKIIPLPLGIDESAEDVTHIPWSIV